MSDLSKTLNLPKTSFPMKADLINREPGMLKLWEEKRLYEKMLEKSKDHPVFILHDGPPYANGDVHLGTAFNKVLKDIIVKTAFLRGFHAPFVPGWDCHGMPIEHRVVEEMGAAAKTASKTEIRKKCREYALRFLDVQRGQFKRLGIFADWEHPYLTLSPEYEGKIVEAFGALVKNGYVYRGLRPIHWCVNCRTALAEAEVEYDNHESPSVYAGFHVKEKGAALSEVVPEHSVSFLIWTTTPWTLPANVAVAVHPDYEYGVVKFSGEGKEEQIFILSTALAEDVASKTGAAFEVLHRMKGSTLEGIVCEHPFVSRDVPVILGDFVTQETGAGCVHIAPGHGGEDYIASLKYKLPVLSPVDESGKFTEEAGESLKGMLVFDANAKIIETLRTNGKLLHTEQITHSYPHCWRCRKPVLFRAAHQWFFNLDENNLRERVLSEIVGVEWVPAWGEDKLTHLIENRPDWCLSRQRSWGVPIPALYCAACGELSLDEKFILAVTEKVKKEGVDFWFEDGKFPASFECKKCGAKEFKKEEDILDVWFESGVSFYSVLKTNPKLSFPADIYLEATDQHRGWFQSSLWPSCALETRAPYRTVVTHGLILDENGKKMSKSLGNVITPEQILKQYGADILRLWFSSVDFTSDVRLSKKVLDPLVETYRKLRNTLRFVLSNLYDFNPESPVPFGELEEIDRFILMKLDALVSQTTANYEKFAFHSVFQALRNFCIVDLSSFYFDVLKDRLYVPQASSHTRRCAQTVLHILGRALTLLAAPVLSFTMEEVWQALPKQQGDEDSVFLMRFPEPGAEQADDEMMKKWDELIKLRYDVNKAMELARNEKLISSPLEAKITLRLPEGFRALDADLLRQVFIVSSVEIRYTREALEGAEKSEYFEDVSVRVEKAGGEKCARCWVTREDVAAREGAGSVCSRCMDVLTQLKQGMTLVEG